MFVVCRSKRGEEKTREKKENGRRVVKIHLFKQTPSIRPADLNPHTTKIKKNKKNAFIGLFDIKSNQTYFGEEVTPTLAACIIYPR